MTALLALGGALAYGVSDFVGGVASRRTSPWAVALVGALVGGALVSLVATVLGGKPGPADFAWAALAGLGNGVGTAFLYRGLGSGRMGVVGPISAVGAAVVPVVVDVASGQRLALLVWAGVVLALPAIWLVSREPVPVAPDVTGARPRRRRAAGLLDGVVAGLGFGTLFAALAQVPREAGLLPVAVNQLVAAALVVLVATSLRVPWAPRERAAGLGAVCGTLGAGATVLFLVASQRGTLTVAAVLVALYPAVTVLLAAAVLRERVHAAQAWGLLLSATSVVLVVAG